MSRDLKSQGCESLFDIQTPQTALHQTTLPNIGKHVFRNAYKLALLHEK